MSEAPVQQLRRAASRGPANSLAKRFTGAPRSLRVSFTKTFTERINFEGNQFFLLLFLAAKLLDSPTLCWQLRESKLRARRRHAHSVLGTRQWATKEARLCKLSSAKKRRITITKSCV